MPAAPPFRTVPALALALAGVPARAGSLDLVALRPLDFGAMVVLGSGSKQIDPNGTVSTSGLAAVAGQREGPAEFTLIYRPDSQTRIATVLLSIATIGSLSSNGAVGTLGNLATDFQGIGRLLPGETRVIVLPPCPPPQCDTVFRVGGRLTLSGGTGQASFSFPLQVTARLLAER